MEGIYEEKLRLSAPVEYWTEIAKKATTKGIYWISALAIVALISVLILMYLFMHFPTLEKLDLSGIRGLAITFTIVSFLGYLIYVSSKMAFSNFHIKHDAEERRTLTYLYLSLINEKDISAKDKEIVFQSLFSRSDSGLLGAHGGPVLPNLSMLKD